MSLETLTVVHFRKERIWTELTPEEIAKHDGEAGPWESLGELLMAEVPQMDRFIFVNGIQYRVKDVTWSVRLTARPGQPNFDDPQVLVTLRRETANSQSPYAPKADFFE